MTYLEPVLGGLAAWLLGAIWYTVLFGKLWQAETGITDEQAKQGVAMTHGLAFVMMVVMSFALNIIINYHEPADQTLMHGGFHGVLAGVFYGVPVIAINYLYQKKSLKLFLIDAAYVVAFLGISGAVMAALKLA